MPRKLLRKLLPSHASIRENRYIAWFGPWLQHHNLWHLNRRGVAGGVAVGMFAGLVPGSNPVQFLAAALLAVIFKVNLPIAAAVTLYTNPVTIAPLYYLAFRLGKLVLLGGGSELPAIDLGMQGRTLAEWLPALMQWLATVGKPLLIGLPLLATILSVVAYFGVDWAWRVRVRMAWRRRQQMRRAAQQGAH